MAKKIKLDKSYLPLWGISSCRENLSNGIMGIIEYHLHKDGSWIGYPFVSMEDKNEKLKELKADGYEYDKITYFEPELFKLENQHLTNKEHLNNLMAFYQKHNQPN